MTPPRPAVPFVMTTHRIESLSDCIFAFSMTLLVMSFTFPSAGQITNEREAITLLMKEIAKFDRYLLTFALLAIFWISHHQQFHYIRRTDRTFLWIQIGILMAIVMVPFTGAWMTAHKSLKATNIIFDLNLFVLGFLFLVSWLYATRKKRLVDEDIEPRVVRRGVLRSLVTCGVAALAIAICFFHVSYSNYAFLLTPALLFLRPFR